MAPSTATMMDNPMSTTITMDFLYQTKAWTKSTEDEQGTTMQKHCVKPRYVLWKRLERYDNLIFRLCCDRCSCKASVMTVRVPPLSYVSDQQDLIHCLCPVDPTDDYERKPTHKNGKPICRYGAACYRVNPDHLRQFWHPPKRTSSDGSGGENEQGLKHTKPKPSKSADEDEISEEESSGERSAKTDTSKIENGVRTLRAIRAFGELDPGVIRDVLVANDGSIHLAMEALKQLTSSE